MKGQHGMMIWVPIGKKDTEPDSTPAPSETTVTEAEGQSTRFIIGTIFDISQTQEIETQANETETEPAVEMVAA